MTPSRADEPSPASSLRLAANVYATASGRLLGTSGMAIIGPDTPPEPWQIVFHFLVGLGTVGAVVADAPVRSCCPQCRLRYHAAWQPGQAKIAATGGADRRSAKNADRPMHQSREAHHPARPLHSPVGGIRASLP